MRFQVYIEIKFMRKIIYYVNSKTKIDILSKCKKERLEEKKLDHNSKVQFPKSLACQNKDIKWDMNLKKVHGSMKKKLNITIIKG